MGHCEKYALVKTWHLWIPTITLYASDITKNTLDNKTGFHYKHTCFHLPNALFFTFSVLSL